MTDNIQDQVLVYSDDEGQSNKQKKGRQARKTKAKQNTGIANTHASTFKDFQLKDELVRGTLEAGFENPSEVQTEGIPYIIFGEDLLCQAKSGMGKTAVFVLGVLQALQIPGDSFQALVLCHTRELAHQISKEFERLGKFIEGLKIATIYGGVNENAQILQLENAPPHIVVGTPGRVKALVTKKKINLKNLKFFILDECDKCLNEHDMRSTIQNIFVQTNHKKQVLMFTATLNDKIRKVAKKYMKDQAKQIVINEEKNLTLHGLQQFYIRVKESLKNKILYSILQKVSFDQVIIFCSRVDRAKYLTKLLNQNSFEAVAIHSDMNQHKRIEKYNQFKKGEKRIICTTDLMARGIDIERVNLVVNFDMPDSSDTYLHRVGRAGRYKTKGNAVSFVVADEDVVKNEDKSEQKENGELEVEAKDMKVLKEIQERFVVKIEELQESFDVKKLDLK